MYFVGFWCFEYNKRGLCGSEFKPIAFFCSRNQAAEFARSWALEHLSTLVVVFDLDNQKPFYFSLFQHQRETDDFKQSVVFCSSLDTDVKLEFYANEKNLIRQLCDSLKLFHVEQFTTKM